MKAYPKKTRFSIWGFGITGQALAEILIERGYQVNVIESRPETDFAEQAELIAKLKASGANFFFNESEKLFEVIRKFTDVFSPSPGIALSKEVISICQNAHVQIAGEIEIAYRLVQGRIIAVTGTDGKTTTVNLIHHILTKAGLTSYLAGNVGPPLISLAGKSRQDQWLVVEVSSYQLETTRLFRPFIALCLNIAEDHLARHGDMWTYIRTKGKLFERQRREDHAIINFDDPASLQAYGLSNSTLHGFSLAGPLPNGAWKQGNDLFIDSPSGPVKIISVDDLKIKGEHNYYNALAAILACHLAGCPHEAIAEGCSTFHGLPHRIEPIAEIKGVLWVNDSKATNVHSVISALKVFDRPIILLLGGFEKGLEITDLIPHIQRRVKHVVLLGDTRNRFRKVLKDADYNEITVRKTLPEACAAADEIAQAGDVVLLSPATSSFDQFKDFAERGDAFRKWVEKRAAKKEH